MNYCANPSCPHRLRTRSAAEFLDHVVTCSDCGTALVEQSALEAAEAALAKDARRPGNESRTRTAGDWDQALNVAHRRAQAAIAALIVTLAMRVYGILQNVWSISILDYFSSMAADLVILAVTATLFLRWLSHTLRAADAMSPVAIRWTSRDAVWGFFIPILNLYRPYEVLRDLHDQLAPNGVPEPAPRPRMDGAGGYRHVAMVQAPPPSAVPHASIGMWWGLYLLSRVFGSGFGHSGNIAGHVAAIAAGMFAVLIMRAVHGRLAERYRRVRYASDEDLAAWGLGRSSAT